MTNSARQRARRRTLMTRGVGGLIATVMVVTLTAPVLSSL